VLNPANISYIKNPIDILKNIFWYLTNRISNKKHIFILGTPRRAPPLQVLLTGHEELGGTMSAKEITLTCLNTSQVYIKQKTSINFRSNKL